MSKQSHTPGPWIFHRAGTFDILTDAKTGQELGQMSLTKEERDLIAAAPEMLEALMMVRQETDDAEWITKLDRIIAKARGTNAATE